LDLGPDALVMPIVGGFRHSSLWASLAKSCAVISF
jgi:hypothetical protein